jgi:hypothetical protein
MMAERSPSVPDQANRGGHDAKEIEMSFGNIPTDPNRPPSNTEKAMSANAQSRDLQGKAADRARRELHLDMIAKGTEEHTLRQRGVPSARLGGSEVE